MVRVKLHLPAFARLRTAPGVQTDLQRRAEAAARSLGAGWVVEDPGTKTRARRAVVPDTAAARLQSAESPHQVVGALDAARHG